MNTKPTLHFFSGKMAAGKSTLAKQLCKDFDAILITEDLWLASLYPDEIIDLRCYLKYSARLKSTLSKHVQSLLRLNNNVVLDFPANTKQQRLWFRELFMTSNADHILHFIDKSDEHCKRPLKQRSQRLPDGAAFTTEAEFDAITKYFQPPLEDEGFNISRYATGIN